MKNINIKLEDLFNLPTAVIFNPDYYKPVTAITIDSRNVRKNSLFVAIKGEQFDGHKFVFDAVKKGATCVVINKKNLNDFNKLDIPFVTVEDTSVALGNLAKLWRSKLTAKIIGITGSAGKTTTKEMLASVLKEKYKVNKTAANNNNHIGVPLTIFSTTNKYEYLILELGTNHFGEIKYTAEIARPDYALITNIGSSHLEFLINKKGVLKEKAALFDETAKNKGTLFINTDDNYLKKMFPEYSEKITYGFLNAPDVKGELLDFTADGKPVLEVKYKNKRLEMIFPLQGEQNARNFLSVAAVAFKLGMKKSEIVEGIKKFRNIDKRLNVKEFENFTLIDDTYNANPESMKFALELLFRTSGSRKRVAILGDMFELGKNAPKLHGKLSAAIRKNKVNELYTTGRLMKNLNEALANSKVKIKHFPRRKSLLKFLQGYDFTNSTILVKGSRGMQMEEFVEAIEAKENK